MSRIRSTGARWCAVLSLLATVGCVSAPVAGAGGERPLPGGLWGGRHANLEVGEEGAAIELDCAIGRIEAPIVLDAEGTFSARGNLSPERGGPLREGEEPPRLGARYRGRLDGETLTLEVLVERPGEAIERLGPFSLVHGRQGRLFKCL